MDPTKHSMDIRSPVPLGDGQGPAVIPHQGVPVLLVAVVPGQAVALLLGRRRGLEIPPRGPIGQGHQGGDDFAPHALRRGGRLLKSRQGLFRHLGVRVVPGALLVDEHIGLQPQGPAVVPQVLGDLRAEVAVQGLRRAQVVHRLKAQLPNLLRDPLGGVPLRHVLRNGRPAPCRVSKLHNTFLLWFGAPHRMGPSPGPWEHLPKFYTVFSEFQDRISNLALLFFQVPKLGDNAQRPGRAAKKGRPFWAPLSVSVIVWGTGRPGPGRPAGPAPSGGGRRRRRTPRYPGHRVLRPREPSASTGR